MITLLLTLSQTALAHPNHMQDWENWTSIAICETEHEQCHTVSEASPRATRNPSIQRFSDPSLNDAKWTELHILRLHNTNESLETRLALLDMLMRSEGDWENGVLFLLEDPAYQMRVLLAESVRFSSRTDSSKTFGHHVLTTLVQDENPLVRIAAYRSISHLETSTDMYLLLGGLDDEDEMVQLAAIRSIGWMKLSIDTELMMPFLTHENPDIRLHSLRAIFRISPEAARSLPQLRMLLEDSNTRVSREAQRIAQ